jgi:hypothetical protein
MTDFLNKLNLRPNERRLVVVVGLFLFILLNLWLVRPHFGDWKKTQLEMGKSRENLSQYQTETTRTNDLVLKLHTLEGQGGRVPTVEQGNALFNTIQSQATINKVILGTLRPVASASNKTNQFFEEQTYVVDISTGEKELVDFLYALGRDDSMIRVKNISLGPDMATTRLQGSITLVASFQRQTPLASGGPGTKAAFVRTGDAANRGAPVQATNVSASRPPGATNRAAPPMAAARLTNLNATVKSPKPEIRPRPPLTRTNNSAIQPLRKP